MYITVCKGCGLAFETKRRRQVFHDYECYVRYKLRTDELWKRKSLDTAELQRIRYKGAKEIEKAQRDKDKRNDSQAGKDQG